MKKAIVLGSGFGGLAIASRLKYRGYDVKLLEKQADLGGRARALSSNGFVYDAGPTVITAPYLINELFELHNEASSDYFELMRVKPFYRFLFSDFHKIVYSFIFFLFTVLNKTDLMNAKRF